MGNDMLERRLQFAVRDGITRAIGAIGLCGIALIHAIDAPSHFGGPDTYLGVMYLGLIATSLALAAALIRGGDRRVWAASGSLAAGGNFIGIISWAAARPGVQMSDTARPPAALTETCRKSRRESFGRRACGLIGGSPYAAPGPRDGSPCGCADRYRSDRDS